MTAAAALGLAGCSVFSPATVLKPYDPSDGVSASLGEVQIRNVLLVSSGVDEPGVLSAVLVNSGAQPQDVSVSVDVDAGAPTSQSFSLEGNTSLRLGDPSAVDADTSAADTSDSREPVGWLQVPQLPVTPGQTVPVTFSVGDQRAEVDAQVMLPCFEYATVTPTAPAPEATATAPAAATPTESVTCGPQVGETSRLGDSEQD